MADAEQLLGVLRAAVTVAPGDQVAELHSSWDRVGEVMALGPGPAEAEAYAADAAAAIDVVTTEEPAP